MRSSFFVDSSGFGIGEGTSISMIALINSSNAVAIITPLKRKRALPINGSTRIPDSIQTGEVSTRSVTPKELRSLEVFAVPV